MIHAKRASFGAGATKLPPLPAEVMMSGSSPALDWNALARALSDDPDSDFARHPTLAGTPVDMSAFPRQRDSQVVQIAERAYGPGLLSRLIARRAEAHAAAHKLALASNEFSRHESLADTLAVVESSTTSSAGIGIGTGIGPGLGHAMTARGPLVYWSHVSSAGAIDDIRTVAPTDWTFHPRGVVREALIGEPFTPTLARDTDWFVLSLDPCVPWSTTEGGIVPECTKSP